MLMMLMLMLLCQEVQCLSGLFVRIAFEPRDNCCTMLEVRLGIVMFAGGLRRHFCFVCVV